MRVECEHCRELVEPAWSIAGSTIRARCPACDATSEVSPPAAAPTPAPPAAAGPECPKCGLAPVTGTACARCGLAVDRMAAWADESTPAPALAEAWDACLADWNDAAAHDRAASVALTVGEQPWLARRYRAVLRRRPDDAIARARLARIGRIAQAAMLATATQPRASRFRRGSSYAVLAALVFAVVGGLLLTLYLVRRNSDDDTPPAAPLRIRATPVSPNSPPWQRPEVRSPGVR